MYDTNYNKASCWHFTHNYRPVSHYRGDGGGHFSSMTWVRRLSFSTNSAIICSMSSCTHKHMWYFSQLLLLHAYYPIGSTDLIDWWIDHFQLYMVLFSILDSWEDSLCSSLIYNILTYYYILWLLWMSDFFFIVYVKHFNIYQSCVLSTLNQ